MKKVIIVLVSLILLVVSASAFAATRGKTDGRSECTVNIVKDWMKKGGKVKVTIMDNRNWNMGGAAYVYVYDEVNVLMRKQMVKGSATLSLPWTRHRFYTLKFENAYSGANPGYYNSVKWKVDTVWGGNVKIQ